MRSLAKTKPTHPSWKWRGHPSGKTTSRAAPIDFRTVQHATSLGLNGQGPLPIDVSRVSETALVAEVVMVPELTPLLQAAQTRGLGIVYGREMLTPQLEAVADFLGMTV